MASAPSKGVLHEDLQRKISLKYSSAVYIYLTVLSYTDQANNFPGPSEVCPGFVRTIFFFSCKNSDLHLIFALVARKRGKRKNCPNTQTMCYKLSVLFDIKTLGQSKTGINFFETLTSEQSPQVWKYQHSRNEKFCSAFTAQNHNIPVLYGCSVKISIVLLDSEKSTINTPTNICPSITLQNKIPGKTVGSKTLMDGDRIASPVKSKNFSLILFNCWSGFLRK